VDDAMVEVENINRNPALEPDKSLDEVILDSAAQIATPAFVSTLSICIVFAPMFLLSGVARYLFLPLAEAVVFAILARACSRGPSFRQWPSICCGTRMQGRIRAE
jgi:multidrug efflux pump subunit AcrB